MRIGIDARLWNETGVGRYIRNLIWELQHLDKENDYVLFVQKGFRTENLLVKNEKWRLIETNIRWHSIKEQLQFPQILEKEKFDLIHFPYFSIPIFYKGPYLITIHDMIINHYPTGKASTLPSPIYYLKHLGYKFVIQQAAKNAKKIITVSQATKEEIVEHLHVSEDKIIVTYEGVGEEINSKLKTQNLKLKFKSQKYFLYVGNAYPHKNLDRLIEAFGLLVQEYPDAHLVLVGKEDYFYKRLKEKVANLKIAKNVIFAGFIPEDELRLYYKNAIATILPSLMEGFGLTGLEAMQNECLVLASAIPSLKEICQDAAVYFDPLEIKDMHATIREVLRNKQKFKSFKEKGKKHVSIFSWKKMAEETLKIYESCSRVRSD